MISYVLLSFKELSIVTKKWDPGILDPSQVKIRKVEARLGKLAKIRKVKTN